MNYFSFVLMPLLVILFLNVFRYNFAMFDLEER